MSWKRRFFQEDFATHTPTPFEWNVRFLAWRRWPDLTWPERFTRMGVTPVDLRADPPGVSLTEHLEARFDMEGLAYTDLLATHHVDVLAENLRCLLRSPGVSVKQVAAALNLSVNTVSRWARGEHHPHPPHLRALVRALHLPPGTDLRGDRLFLLDEPPTHAARLNHLRGQLEHLPPDRLAELYPALTCLLGRPTSGPEIT